MPDHRTRTTRVVALVLGAALTVAGAAVFVTTDFTFAADVATAAVIVLGLGFLRYGWPRRGRPQAS